MTHCVKCLCVCVSANKASGNGGIAVVSIVGLGFLVSFALS